MKLNNNLNIIFLCTFLFLFTSCGSGEDVNKNTIEDQPAKNMLYVLCDFSTSIDAKETKANILNTAKDIFRNMPANTEYHFIPITGGPESDLFTGNSGEDEDAQDRYTNHIANYAAYEKLLDDAYQSRKSDRSSIISAIESVSESLISLNRSSEKYGSINLLIISDMMECCKVNGIPFNLEKEQFDSSAADQLINSWPKEKKFLSNANNLNITVLFNSKANQRYADIKGFWKKFFKTVGYTKDVPFVTSFDAKSL